MKLSLPKGSALIMTYLNTRLFLYFSSVFLGSFFLLQSQIGVVLVNKWICSAWNPQPCLSVRGRICFWIWVCVWVHACVQVRARVHGCASFCVDMVIWCFECVLSSGGKFYILFCCWLEALCNYVTCILFLNDLPDTWKQFIFIPMEVGNCL